MTGDFEEERDLSFRKINEELVDSTSEGLGQTFRNHSGKSDRMENFARTRTRIGRGGPQGDGEDSIKPETGLAAKQHTQNREKEILRQLLRSKMVLEKRGAAGGLRMCSERRMVWATD